MVASTRMLKDLLYEQVGRLAKGMANGKRLELVELLCQAPKSVEMLAAESGISVKLVSAHLKELRLAHLVETQRNGRQIIYRIACPEVAALLVAMRTLAADRLLELQHSIKALGQDATHWSEVDGSSLWKMAKNGEVTVIDVRPFAEYSERHFPFARSLPLAELREKIKTLPKDKPVVAYCRGPFCTLSLEAVKWLQAEGFQSFQWREGAADWIAKECDTTRTGEAT